MASNVYGLSDTSSLSSEASQAPDECLNGTVAGRKPTGRRNFNVRVYGSNNVTVGPKSKIVHLDPTQRRESETGRQYDRVPEEVNIRVVENIPNSYCVKSAHGLKRMERDEEWNPRPTKGIILNEDPENYTYTVGAFFNNPDQFIQEMDKCGGSCKEQREQFILLKILPHLEEMWGKCSSSNEEVYKNLAKISCSVNSGTVVRHALHLLLRLVCKDNLGSGKGKLQVAEGVLRSSIVSPEGRLRKDEHSEGQLKLFVYSRILTSLFIQLQQEQLSLLALERLELKEVKKILKGYSEQIQHKKKDVFRYAMEYIIKIIPYLLQPREKSKVKGLITECQEFCGHHHIKSEGILETVKKIPKGEWVDLHCILIYLQGKMHNESPIAQMESELRAMKLFGLIVGTCLEQSRWGGDWKFCLIALPILADIANSNITKEMRKEANSCLEKLLKDAEVQKKPESRIILEQQLSKFVFCKDVETRKLLVEFWFNALDPPNHLPAAYHTEHLSSMYRTQTLEINETSVCKKSACFVNHGMFHRQKVAIKVLYANKRHLLEDDPNFKDRQRLIREVYNMGRLNASQHPNFPVLLGYDTKTLPYHLITAFERWGNLLQLVRLSRDKREPHLTPNDVIEMILGISQALSFLEGRGFVHRAVMAENVLVGSNFVCKLSGLHFMRQLRSPLSDEDVDTEDGYCSPNQFIPEYFSTSGEEDPPVRWRAPECLTKNRYSTASDVWAFGVLMYEVLSFGRIPYEHVPNDDALHIHIVDHKEIVPRESCFEDKEYELIKQFCEWESNYRLRRFTKVIERLQELLHHQQRYSENVRRSPPGSTEHIGSQDSRTAPSSDLEGEARCDLIRITEEGRTFVWEKISNDFLHVKGLLDLKDPNLVSVDNSIMDDSGLYWIISPECPNENLKEYVLNRQCKLKHIVMFLSQVASALHYLHVRHIVHGDLRAEYVNVVAEDKVQVGRLRRSKRLSMNVDDKDTSKLCVKQADMPPDAHRWSAPEVISDGLYTHASDVWAFGILAWELYTSFTKGQDRRELSVPYCSLYKREILPYMRNNGPLGKPEDCPYWVYVIMHQCWTFSSGQRPPFLAIFDCLTSREPMKSWLMERWKQRKGKESDFPDLSILQEEDASHVLGKEEHPSKEDIERMCLEGFFTEHGYRYVRDESNENGENLQVDKSGIRRMEVVSVEKQADESNSITENKTGAHHQTSGDATRLTNFSTKESETACSDSEVTGFHVMPQNEDPGNYSPCQQHDGQGGCTSEYPIGSCAERRDEENIDCEIYDDVMPKQEALEPQHVPPGNYTTAVEHRADFEDEHQSNIEGGCQNVPQENATQIVAEGTDRGRGPNVSQALKPQHVLPENYPTGVQDLLNDPCTWEVFV